MNKLHTYLRLLLIIGLLGLIDGLYLTYQHYADTIPPCSINSLIDCGKVLGSQYAVIYGIPLALVGAVHYGVFIGLIGASMIMQNFRLFQLGMIQSILGACISLYLVYLQLGVLGAVCLFCMGSAIISFTLAGIALSAYRRYEHPKAHPQSD